MNKYLSFLFALALITVSCNIHYDKKIKGNGVFSNDLRNAENTHKIKIAGSLDVELTQGTGRVITIRADANLLPFIITEYVDGWLVVKTKSGYSLSSQNPITVSIETDVLEAVTIAGNGNVKGMKKFEGGDQLKVKIAGNGDVNLNVNTPKVDANIAGNGNIILEGETKDANITIAGNGDYRGEKLKAENAKVKIAGMGNVNVFSANNLDIDIAGSGDVRYVGNPTITKHIAGSGSVKAIQ
jgi:hypothetical protein